MPGVVVSLKRMRGSTGHLTVDPENGNHKFIAEGKPAAAFLEPVTKPFANSERPACPIRTLYR